MNFASVTQPAGEVSVTGRSQRLKDVVPKEGRALQRPGAPTLPHVPLGHRGDVSGPGLNRLHLCWAGGAGEMSSDI